MRLLFKAFLFLPYMVLVEIRLMIRTSPFVVLFFLFSEIMFLKVEGFFMIADRQLQANRKLFAVIVDASFL